MQINIIAKGKRLLSRKKKDEGERKSSCLPFKWCFKWVSSCEGQIVHSTTPGLLYTLILCILYFVMLLLWQSGVGQDGHFVHVSENNVHLCLMVFMLFALIGIATCIIKRWRNERFVRSLSQDKQITNRYMMIGAYTFGVGTLLLCVQLMFALAYCPEGNMIFFFQTTRFLFTLIQLLFLQGFCSVAFPRTAWIIILLHHIIATNFCVWLLNVSQETGVLGEPKEESAHERCRNSSKVSETAEVWEDYTTPFSLEYSLIVAGIVTRIRGQINSPLNSAIHETKESNVGCSRVNETDTTISTSGHQSIPRISQINVLQKGARLGFVTGLVLSIIMIVSSLSLEENNKSKLQDWALCFDHCFTALVIICQLVAYWAVLDILKGTKWEWHDLKSEDYLLIGSGCGIIGYDILGFIAEIDNFKAKDRHQVVAGLTFSSRMIHFLGAIIQILALVQLRRFKLVFNVNEETRDERRGPVLDKTTLDYACIFLTVINLGFWAVDSFFEIKSSVFFPDLETFYGHRWKLYRGLLYPLAIFFRFHASIMILDTWYGFYNNDYESQGHDINDQHIHSLDNTA